MSKRTLLMVVSIVASLALAATGTLAYLSDSDMDVNVMTLGKVDIVQNEQERRDDGTLDAFTDNKPLLPAVFPGSSIPYADGSKWPVPNDFTWRVVEDNENVVDKFVTVTNTGKTDAYVRTIVAVEAGCVGADTLIHTVQNDANSSIEDVAKYFADYETLEQITIDGVIYDVLVFTYAEPLEPGETSVPSLKQIYMNKAADNDFIETLGETFDVLVLSQAVQADGFAADDKNPAAVVALTEAFGDITEDNVRKWFAEGTIETDDEDNNPPLIADVVVSNDEELVEAVEGLEAGEELVIGLKNGTYTTNLQIPGGSDVAFLGDGNTVLQGQIASTSSTPGTITLKDVTVKVDASIEDSTGISQTGKSAIALWGTQSVVCDNVTFDMSLADATAITSWWDTGVGTSITCTNCTFNCNGQRPIRATGNVTVENCTFNDPYRYAVQLTAKASTATELENAVCNFNNNTIINGENGKDFVYGVQLEGSDYGCKDLIINGSGNTIENGGTESAMYYCECGKVEHETVVFNTEVAPVHEN